MKFKEGQCEFVFLDAIDGLKFDEQDKSSPFFHGLSHCMKAVDFVVELPQATLFVEIKDFRS